MPELNELKKKLDLLDPNLLYRAGQLAPELKDALTEYAEVVRQLQERANNELQELAKKRAQALSSFDYSKTLP